VTIVSPARSPTRVRTRQRCFTMAVGGAPQQPPPSPDQAGPGRPGGPASLPASCRQSVHKVAASTAALPRVTARTCHSRLAQPSGSRPPWWEGDGSPRYPDASNPPTKILETPPPCGTSRHHMQERVRTPVFTGQLARRQQPPAQGGGAATFCSKNGMPPSGPSTPRHHGP
jgi:hypothetical protein